MKAFSHLKVDGFSDCRVQGSAVDEKREYILFSLQWVIFQNKSCCKLK